MFAERSLIDRKKWQEHFSKPKVIPNLNLELKMNYKRLSKTTKDSHQLVYSTFNLYYEKSVEMFLITKQYKLIFEID